MSREIPLSEGNVSYDDEELEALAKAEQEAIENPTGSGAVGIVGSGRNPLTPGERVAIKVQFLELLCKGQSVSRAVNIINGQSPGTWHSSENGKITRKTLYVWRKFDREFAKDWDEAFQMGTDNLEDVGHGYALEGNAALLQFLLRVRNPKRYAMNRHEVSGPGGGAIPVTEVTRTIIDPQDDPDHPDKSE